MARSYHSFKFKDSNFRICCRQVPVACNEIVRQREILEEYILRQPDFMTSLTPLMPLPDAPEIAIDMCESAARAAVGPLAAVAGAIAERAVRAALAAGDDEAIVENGGDIFAASRQSLTIALHAGEDSPFNRLAFKLEAADMPRAICSSSSHLGHSLSLGNCDLATVIAQNAALADAAATKLCNMVRSNGDMDAALQYITSIDGIDGALVINHGHIGLLGELPELIRNNDQNTERKITRDPLSKA